MTREESNGLKKHLWAIVGLLLVQTLAAVFWAGSIHARMNHAERDIQSNGQRIHELATDNN